MLQIEQVAHSPADLAPDLHPAQLGVPNKDVLWALVNRLGGMANSAYVRSGGMAGDDPNSILKNDLWRWREFAERTVRAMKSLLEST